MPRIRQWVVIAVKPLAPKLERSALKIYYTPAEMYKNIARYEKKLREIFWKK